MRLIRTRLPLHRIGKEQQPETSQPTTPPNLGRRQIQHTSSAYSLTTHRTEPTVCVFILLCHLIPLLKLLPLRVRLPSGVIVYSVYVVVVSLFFYQQLR